MTLRITLEIVPWGDDAAKYSLGVIDIHNDGTGVFGHDRYYGSYQEHPQGTYHITDIEPISFENVEHNRRDGPLELTKKVIERLQEEASRH